MLACKTMLHLHANILALLKLALRSEPVKQIWPDDDFLTTVLLHQNVNRVLNFFTIMLPKIAQCIKKSEHQYITAHSTQIYTRRSLRHLELSSQHRCVDTADVTRCFLSTDTNHPSGSGCYPRRTAKHQTRALSDAPAPGQFVKVLPLSWVTRNNHCLRVQMDQTNRTDTSLVINR